MLNLGVGFGLMASVGRLDTFLGLVLPHGLLELTAVFVAAGTGLRLGWTLIDPGPRPRRRALAEEGRAALAMAIGLALVLFVSGAIEGFVTPSGLPTWARITIGVVAERPSWPTSTSWAGARLGPARPATWRRPNAAPSCRRQPDVRGAPFSR
ncbi:hypothetical protein SHIRM173S_08007 [Streptomyces hirsutus]